MFISTRLNSVYEVQHEQDTGIGVLAIRSIAVN